MPAIAAGALRHRVTIRRAAQVQNRKGGYDTTWAPIATMWAAIAGMTGFEEMTAQALEGVSAYRIVTRWRGDVRQSDQVVLPDGVVLNVRSATDPDGKRRMLQILADDGAVKTAA